MNYSKEYDNYLKLFNQELNLCISSICDRPQILKDAMVYAVSGGGKRIRPVLCFATAKNTVASSCSSKYSLKTDAIISAISRSECFPLTLVLISLDSMSNSSEGAPLDNKS